MAATLHTPQLAEEIPALSFLYPFEWENQWVRPPASSTRTRLMCMRHPHTAFFR